MTHDLRFETTGLIDKTVTASDPDIFEISTMLYAESPGHSQWN